MCPDELFWAFCEDFQRDYLDATEDSAEYLKRVFYFSLFFDDERAKAVVRALAPPETLRQMAAQPENAQNKAFRRLLLDFIGSTPGVEGAAVPCSGACPKADEETAVLREYGLLPNAALPTAFDSNAIFARRGAVPNSLSSARIGAAKLRSGAADFVPTDFAPAVKAFRLPARDVPQGATSYLSAEYAVGAGPVGTEGYVAARLRGDEAQALRIVKGYCPRVFLERAAVSECQAIAADWLDAVIVDYLYARKGDEALGREAFAFSSSASGDFERFKRASAKLFSTETTAEEAEAEIATLLNLNEAGYASAGTAVCAWDVVRAQRRARSYRLSIKDPIAAFLATCRDGDFQLSDAKKQEIKKTFFYRDAIFLTPNARYFTSEETLDRWFDAAEKESPFLGAFPATPLTGTLAEALDRRLQAALQRNFEIDFVAEAKLIRARIAALRQDWATCDAELKSALARLRIEAASALVGWKLGATVDWTSDDFTFDASAARELKGCQKKLADGSLQALRAQTRECDMFQRFAPRTARETAVKTRLDQTRRQRKRLLDELADMNFWREVGNVLQFLLYILLAAISYLFFSCWS